MCEIQVVVATNIAETSITIPGIVYVVDSMFVKVLPPLLWIQSSLFLLLEPFHPRGGPDSMFVKVHFSGDTAPCRMTAVTV